MQTLNTAFRDMLRASYGDRLPSLSNAQLTDLRRAFFGGAISTLAIPYRTISEDCSDFMEHSRRPLTNTERAWLVAPQ